MKLGIMAIVVAHIKADQSVPYCPLNIYSPKGIVFRFSLLVTISGHRKDFQLSTKLKMARDAMPGLASGSIIFQYSLNGLQPSIFAASSTSNGIVTKNWRIKKVPKAVNAGGTINAR